MPVVIAATTQKSGEMFSVLRTFGYELRLADSVQETAAVLAAAQTVTAVVTDVALCDGNWRDVVERVRSSGLDIPIVLRAPCRTAELWWDALEAGVSEVIAGRHAVSELGTFLREIAK